MTNVTSLECPYGPAVLEDTAAHGSALGEAFELSSDTPIQVYDIVPYGGAESWLPSASLIYPHSAWGTDYVAITPHELTAGTWIIALARNDNTTVTIEPTVNFTPGSITDAPMGVETQYTIDAGEFLQWSGTLDAAGSIVTADKPLAMFTGNTYLRVDTADGPLSGQDAAHQQVTDVNRLAHEYIGAGLATRRDDDMAESVLYRLVGVVDNTQLDWDPEPPTGAPMALDAGDVVQFESREFFSVRSQDAERPFSLTQYMSGSLGFANLGDDEWVTLVPPQQFLRRYAFFVDPTYLTSSLVITRTRGAGGFADVDLECMGTIDGWEPVGDDGIYEVAHVMLFEGGTGDDPDCGNEPTRRSQCGALRRERVGHG